MRHRIPPNIDPLKKYATYVELIQKKSQDSEILTKHLIFNKKVMNWEEIKPLTELDILRITFIYETIKGMSQKYRVNIQ